MADGKDKEVEPLSTPEDSPLESPYCAAPTSRSSESCESTFFLHRSHGGLTMFSRFISKCLSEWNEGDNMDASEFLKLSALCIC